MVSSLSHGHMEMHVDLTMFRAGTKSDNTIKTIEPTEGGTLASGAGLRWFLQKIEELEKAGVCRWCGYSALVRSHADRTQDRDIVVRKFQVGQWIVPPIFLRAPSVLIKIA